MMLARRRPTTTMVENVLSMESAAAPCKPAATDTALTDASVEPAFGAGYVRTAFATRRNVEKTAIARKTRYVEMRHALSV